MRLFHRSTRSLSLTQDGELLLESCRRIVSEIESIEHKFAQKGDDPKGRLRVAVPLMCDLFVPLLKQFMQAYPGIELDLVFSDCVVDVIEDGYDVAIQTGRGTDSRLMSRRLASYKLVIVGSPEYFSRAGVPHTPKDLCAHVCMHHKHPSTGKLQEWPFARESENDVTLPVSASASTLESLIHFVQCGAGISCLPDFSIRAQIADGSLRRVLDNCVEHTDDFRAVWPSSRHLSPKIRVFVDFMVQRLLEGKQADGG